ncbi:type II toxin-antitoxin system VapC family toxin [Kaistella palustris]|uniref:type II toxin-antitoxin system VapC family toxin n=1 Tax=Kaistella palustris TaxID=493376 RepID=UPI00041B22D2|nr:PIN domain-containing protein [Kaistella palustris]
MEKLFVDTNIVLDLLQKRPGFFEGAQELFTLADKKLVTLYVSALTIANTHFLLQKHLKGEARKVLAKFKILVEILPLDGKILELAMVSDFSDFEDAVQYYTALENEMDLIITRNKKDFKNVSLPVLTATEYLYRK